MVESNRKIVWVGSSRQDLKKFPEVVRKDMGHMLHDIQTGGKPRKVKRLKGFDGVFEIKMSHSKDAYRTVYATKIAEVIYILHAFKKKSKTGISTPKKELALIHSRLVRAKEMQKSEQNKE